MKSDGERNVKAERHRENRERGWRTVIQESIFTKVDVPRKIKADDYEC